jgi:hypothetical protein
VRHRRADFGRRLVLPQTLTNDVSEHALIRRGQESAIFGAWVGLATLSSVSPTRAQRESHFKDDAVQSPGSTDAGHADGALLDLFKVHEVSADERPGNTSDIGAGAASFGANSSASTAATAAGTNPGSRIPTPCTGLATR